MDSLIVDTSNVTKEWANDVLIAISRTTQNLFRDAEPTDQGRWEVSEVGINELNNTLRYYLNELENL
jgi:hypothetical protein